MSNLLHVGLDVGSTTVKIVVMNSNLDTIYTNYTRHFSDTKKTVCDVLEKLVSDYPDNTFTVNLTGSGAMSAATFLDLPFIQEVISCKRAVKTLKNVKNPATLILVCAACSQATTSDSENPIFLFFVLYL